VVWNLAVGAPDQVAGILMGAKGSATQLFGDRIDIIFAAIAEAGQNVGGGAQGAAQQTAAQVAQGTFTPANLMWLAALLLLGTVGVLVTARIALAVLLALGPIFVIFGLFSGTRGLTAGWLRGVVLTAVTPLFVVVGGGMMLELLIPVVANLRGETGINGRAALALFTIAAVHVSLMAMVLKVGGTVVSGWQVFGLGKGEDADRAAALPEAPPAPVSQTYGASGAVSGATSSRARQAAAAATLPVEVHAVPAEPSRGASTRTIVNQVSRAGSDLPPLPPTRSRGVGSRFSAPPRQVREMRR
jgi:type IV secretion system protein VirB6